MERKEKGISSYLWVFLFTAVFFALLLRQTGRVQTERYDGYGVRTQRESVLPTALSRERIDVNTASAQELQALTGVGVALAEEIVREREENGPFESVEDLLRVKGIGESKIEEFRYEVTAGGIEK